MKGEEKFEELRLAIRAGNGSAVVQAVSEGFDVNSMDLHGQTPLMFAAEEGQKHILEALIAAGARLDMRDRMSFHDGGGKTALHRATANRHFEIVQTLCLAGAAVNVADKSKETPLSIAIQNNDVNVAELLLRAGANANGSGKASTPLSIAATMGFSSAVALLLQHGANPNHTADNHWPPLHYAALGSFHEICQMLIDAGAKIDAKNADGRTALECINKTIDSTAWKHLPSAEIENLERIIADREVTKDMLIKAAING